MNKTISNVFLAPGDKILAVHRRLYEGDEPRLFTASVDAFENGLLKATGHSWVPCPDGFLRKPESRTKLLSLSSGALLVYQLPQETNLATLEVVKLGNRVVLKDDGRVSMDLTESEME